MNPTTPITISALIDTSSSTPTASASLRAYSSRRSEAPPLVVMALLQQRRHRHAERALARRFSALWTDSFATPASTCERYGFVTFARFVPAGVPTDDEIRASDFEARFDEATTGQEVTEWRMP